MGLVRESVEWQECILNSVFGVRSSEFGISTDPPMNAKAQSPLIHPPRKDARTEFNAEASVEF